MKYYKCYRICALYNPCACTYGAHCTQTHRGNKTLTAKLFNVTRDDNVSNWTDALISAYRFGKFVNL